MYSFDNGDNLIDELVQAVIQSALDPADARLLKAAGRKREFLERYVFRLETKLGIRGKNGRYS